MLDLTKPLQTRDGNKVAIISGSMCSDGSFGALIREDNNDNWRHVSYNSNGTVSGGAGLSGLDLINTPTKHKLTGFLNVYETDKLYSGIFHEERKEADNTMLDRVACLDLSKYDIEFEEGEGIEKPGD